MPFHRGNVVGILRLKSKFKKDIFQDIFRRFKCSIMVFLHLISPMHIELNASTRHQESAKSLLVFERIIIVIIRLF